jgi:hypothetical protein
MAEYCGQCLCGAVRYRAKGLPVIVAQCHCEDCRRLSGTGHTVGAMFSATDVTLTGDLGTYQYTSAKGSRVTRAFCPACGSPIYGQNTQTPDHITLPLGTMDAAQGLAIQVVIFDRDKPHWDQLGPEVMSFATQPDWTPED